MKVRRAKPYVCVDVDYADHHRFQATSDIEAASGTWLRCLAHSRAQEQDGVVMAAWLRRTFASTYERVEELIRVGLLRVREDGDYEIHAYAPRNQTRAMVAEERAATRERVREWRRSGGPNRSEVTRYKGVTNADVTNDDRTSPSPRGGSSSTREANGSHTASPREARAALAPSALGLSSAPSSETETREKSDACEASGATPGPAPTGSVTPYNRVTTDDVTPYETVSNAFVPTSISLSYSSSFSSLSSSDSSLEDSNTKHVRAVPRADADTRAPEERLALPPSERALSGSFWLGAFSDGIREQTGRPCSIGRVYLGTLERIVTHHAPHRDAPRATAWLKDQAKAFAAQWDGKHPAKGLTPDGLERWLNEGKQPPPVFGRPRIVQPPAEEWHADDWSDLGAKVNE